MLVTRSEPRTVTEADLCLRFALAGLHRAQAFAAQVGDGQRFVAIARARIDRFLEVRLELSRREADAYIECWWTESWPASAPPQWPDQGAASEAVETS